MISTLSEEQQNERLNEIINRATKWNWYGELLCCISIMPVDVAIKFLCSVSIEKTTKRYQEIYESLNNLLNKPYKDVQQYWEDIISSDDLLIPCFKLSDCDIQHCRDVIEKWKENDFTINE